MTKNEEIKAKKFIEEHSKCSFISSISGKYSYIITPTIIGDYISIRCNACKVTKDITDVKSCNKYHNEVRFCSKD